MNSKKEIRTLIAQKKSQLSEGYIVDNSKAVFDNIFNSLEYKENCEILTYVSYNQEVDTKKFILRCIEDGKNVYVPKVIKNDYGKTMIFVRIKSFDDLQKGYMGISEPVSDEESLVDKGLMIMPGLAFDREFNRIGYGGGFYDRYLEEHKNILKIGVCFDFQLFDSIPCEEHDLKPDIVVTQNEVLDGREL
ncbi:MAG: 5-formyltetrahydrofolate cyclo-ligase [Eubacteriales bacterium]|nr:5-formyltetrahydrofolate cyclo-ligase [Eubacteriales bacterium]